MILLRRIQVAVLLCSFPHPIFVHRLSPQANIWCGSFFLTNHLPFPDVLYILHTTHLAERLLVGSQIGQYLRAQREKKKEGDSAFTLRKVAEKIGVEPSYLSKIERGIERSPSEHVLNKLAALLDEDPDLLLAMAGKISSDLSAIIRKRPLLFAELIRQAKNLPDNAILRVVREVRDGSW